MKKILLAGFIVVLGVAGFAGFSGYPAKWAVRHLFGAETKVTGVGGNWVTGYRFASMKGSTSYLEFEISGATVRPGFGVLFGSTHVESLEADRLALVPRSANDTGIKVAHEGKSASGDFGISSLEVKSLGVWNIARLGKPFFDGGTVHAKQLVFGNTGFTFQLIEGHGASADFKMTSTLEANSGTTLALTGTIKAGKDSAFLHDVPISAQVHQGKGGAEGYFSALNDKIKVSFDKSMSLDFQVTDLTPSEEFKNTVPFAKMNMSIHADGKTLVGALASPSAPGLTGGPFGLLVAAMAPLAKGGFLLGDTKFQFAPLPAGQTEAPGALALAKGEKGGSKYSLYFKPFLAFVIPGMWMIRGPKGSADNREIVANLYYGKPVAKLSTPQKETVVAASKVLWKEFPSFAKVAPKSGTMPRLLPAVVVQGTTPPKFDAKVVGFPAGLRLSKADTHFQAPPPPGGALPKKKEPLDLLKKK